MGFGHTRQCCVRGKSLVRTVTVCVSRSRSRSEENFPADLVPQPSLGHSTGIHRILWPQTFAESDAVSHAAGRPVHQSHRQRQCSFRRHRQAAHAEAPNQDRPQGGTTAIVPRNQQSDAFGTVETRVASTFNQPGGRDDWQQVGGAWVLRPKSGRPKAVVHFVGGAFVGAAPQLTYRLLLELLAAKQLLVCSC